MAQLTFTLEDGQEIVVDLQTRTTVGRHEGNDLIVDDPQIAGNHAEIRQETGGSFEICDLGSSTGTYVNGARVESSLLQAGDQVTFGPLTGIFRQDGAGFKTDGAPVLAHNGHAPEESLQKGPAADGWDGHGAPEARPHPESPAASGECAGDPRGTQSPAALHMRIAGLHDEVNEAQDERDRALAALRSELDQVKAAKLELARVSAEIEATQRGIAEGALQLRQYQERFAQATTAVQAAEARQSELAEGLKTLSAEHASLETRVIQAREVHKDAQASVESSLSELQTMTAHQQEAVAHLEQLERARELALTEQGHMDSHLSELHKAVSDHEVRARDAAELAQAREDQVLAAERRVEQIEQIRLKKEGHVAELSGTEEKLSQALAKLLSAEERHGEVARALAELDSLHASQEAHLADLASRISQSQKQHGGLEEGISQARTALAGEEKALRARQDSAAAARQQLEAEQARMEKEASGLRQHILNETQSLADLTRHREETQRQLEELAGTDQKLAAARAALLQTESCHQEAVHTLADTEARLAEAKAGVEKLSAEEDAAKGRLDVLRGRESDLRKALQVLSQREHEDRGRFEEIQRLVSEAEAGSRQQQEDIERRIELSRRELNEVEMKLLPLRDWKDAMDKRYERLAALPESSAEARELWHEIESEKASLKQMMLAQRAASGAGVGAPAPSVLKSIIAGEGVSAAGPEAPAVEPARWTRSSAGKPRGLLHAPPAMSEESSDPVERARVGNAGTGALMSGTGQEMALKARLNRLRESVQREATRLEFLRQERAREESRARAGGAAASEAVTRQHDRHLEQKVRREEEHLASVQRNIELTEMEEEKRRERIAEFERRISEIRADLAELERERSDAVVKAEIAQVELKTIEDALERRRMAEME